MRDATYLLGHFGTISVNNPALSRYFRCIFRRECWIFSETKPPRPSTYLDAAVTIIAGLTFKVLLFKRYDRTRHWKSSSERTIQAPMVEEFSLHVYFSLCAPSLSLVLVFCFRQPNFDFSCFSNLSRAPAPLCDHRLLRQNNNINQVRGYIL